MDPILVEALLAASSDHLPRVEDVHSTPSSRRLLLEPLDGPVLAELLAARGALSPGEAVTVLLGCARAIAALHAVGYLGTTNLHTAVQFDSRGRPLLAHPPSLRRMTSPAGTSEDWRELGRLGERLGVVTPSRSGATTLDLALAAVVAHESEHTVAQLDDALFAFAEPEPIRLDAAPHMPTAVVAAPEPDGLGRAVPPIVSRRSVRVPRRSTRERLLAIVEQGPGAELRRTITRLRARLAGERRPRRRVLILGALVAGAGVLAALLLLPGQEDGHQPAPKAAQSENAAPKAAEPTPTRTESAQAKTAESAKAVQTKPVETDPVRAIPALLAARDSCLAEHGSAHDGAHDSAHDGARDESLGSCLATIADSASADLSRPAAALAPYRPSLIERAGDSALIALTPPEGAQTPPASALLMRTEAGWRLRQLFVN